MNPSEFKWTQVNQREIKWTQVHPRKHKWSLVNPSVHKCTQVQPSPMCSLTAAFSSKTMSKPKCNKVHPSVSKCTRVNSSESKCTQVYPSVPKCTQVHPSSMCSLTAATAPSHVTVCYVSDMINLQLSAAFVAWAATTFLAHFSVKQILTTVAPDGFEVYNCNCNFYTYQDLSNRSWSWPPPPFFFCLKLKTL